MLKGIVNGAEKDIVRVPMFDNDVEYEGWEVRDQQDRLIWGREDVFEGTDSIPFKGYSLPLKVKSLLGNAVQNGTPSPGPVNPNLADPSATVPGYQESNGSIHTPSAAEEITTDFIPFTNTLYILISGSANGDMNYAAYNANKQIIGIYNTGFTPNTVITADPQSYTGAAYLRASWTHGVDQPICITTKQTTTFIPFDPNPPGPIMPTFCGVRTANLFDGSGIATSVNGVYVDSVGQMLYFHGKASGQGGRLNPLSNDIILDAGTYRIRAFGQKSIQLFLQKKGDSTKYYRFDNTTPAISLAEQTTFFISSGVIGDTRYDETVGIVLVSGSTTPTSYVPYGWQIPITCAGQTTPVYLGQVQTVRQIKKYEFTGIENIIDVGDYYNTNVFVSSRAWSSTVSTTGGFQISNTGGRIWATKTHFPDCTTPDAFKTYLQQQYANGTPVTVWYVLATPQTGIVNEPLCKISTYADELNDTVATLPEIPTTTGENTLTVDTTLAPSKLEVSVHAKKIHYGFKIDKSNDDSETAVIYTHDAVTMTPAHMDFTNDRFDYGSWGNAFFVRDCYPVALNLDGTIAYRLDPDDYTKKMDGTASDIFYELLTTAPSDWSTQWKQYYTKSGDEYVLNNQNTAPTFATDTYYKLTYNSSFTGNFMMAFPKV